MVAASRAAAGMGYTGYPAHIFYMKAFFERQDTHFKRMWTLEQWYSDLRGYLPVLFEKTSPIYEETIFPKLETFDERINKTWNLYEQRYDDPSTWNPEELSFNRRVVGCLRDLDEITAISRVINKEKIEGYEVLF
jgi:hypothetical protein